MRPTRQPGLQPTTIRHFGVASFSLPMLGTEVCLILVEVACLSCLLHRSRVVLIFWETWLHG